MTDCPNGDVRDLLPDLLHDRLDPAARAMVEAHVVDCADCQLELALLRDLRSALRGTPALDLNAIGAGVPAYRAPVRRSWVGWRTAAAITFVAAGVSSLAVWQRGVVPSSESASPVVQTPVSIRSAARLAPAEGRELGVGGGSLTDLSERELASLLREIETLDALPSTDVEAPSIAPIAPRRGHP
jgi:hypothetical protein